jgi:GrpB-like predicted nucleotidyltransferase (UPF0157 family)
MIDEIKRQLSEYEIATITRQNFEQAFEVYSTNQDFFISTQGKKATIENSIGDVDDFHFHVVYPGDHDKILFKDYLISHPEATVEYADLKRGLFESYEHDRDGYTEAKGEFVREIVRKARKL